MNRIYFVAVLLVFWLMATPALAQDTITARDLMTRQEWTEYQSQIRNAKTATERQALRTQHVQEMERRAAAQGKMLRHQAQKSGAGRQGREMGQGGGPPW